MAEPMKKKKEKPEERTITIQQTTACMIAQALITGEDLNATLPDLDANLDQDDIIVIMSCVGKVLSRALSNSAMTQDLNQRTTL